MTTPDETSDPPPLRRRLSFTLLTLYGLGTTIGAGIYVLVGEVAAAAGLFAPISFLIAAFLAAFTAMSFGALAARYPRSAGEAVYVDAAFGKPHVSVAVGLSVALVGLISCAAIVSGVVGYLRNLVGLPDWLIVLLVVLLLAAIAAWGIAESVTVAAAITVLEIGGLLVVLLAGREALADLPSLLDDMPSNWRSVGWAGLCSGTILAFYAFIGFEDMVNVAEEVREPERNYPRAIAVTLIVTAALYTCVSMVSITALPLDELAASGAPISDIFERLTGLPGFAIDGLASVAVVNGALIQIIMSSRVFYGLARQGWLPDLLGQVNERTRTPLAATVFAGVLVLGFAFALPLVTLAKITSFITLLIFAMVNLALLRLIEMSESEEPRKRRFPRWVPLCGFVFSIAFALFQFAEFVGI